MSKTEAQKRARIKYDSENMSYQTIKVSKQLLQDFRAAVTANGDKVNTVLRLAMIDYIGKTATAPATPSATVTPSDNPPATEDG